MYTSMITQTGLYALYFHTTELSNGQLFHEVRSYQVTFVDQSVAMLKANGHDYDLTVKLAVPELTKKTVELTN